MTTEGGVDYGALLRMEDKERNWWYQKCVDYNEEMEEKLKTPRRGR